MRIASLMVLALALVAGCEKAGGGSSAASGKPRVVATTTMIGDLVKQIAGDRVDLVVIMPPGTDPHTFKPATKDLADVQRAKLVLYNGLHLEGTMVDLFERTLKDRSVAVTRDLDPAKDVLHDGGAHDPHVWFDVRLWSRAAKTVADALAAADPAGAADYAARHAELATRLDALDAWVTESIKTIPADRRVLITSHDAFSYYGRRYGIEVRGLQGISTETEAGIPNIRQAVTFIVARKIPAIFVESSVNPQTIERVRADCAAAGVDVKIGGELYSDAMGKPGERPGYAVETYEGMVRYNTDLIVRGLK